MIGRFSYKKKNKENNTLEEDRTVWSFLGDGT